MNVEKALKTLGLDSAATAAEIESTYKIKSELIENKRTAAPTEALQQKFDSMLESLAQAKQLLSQRHVSNNTENVTAKQFKPNPLSDTKMHDLPGTGQSEVSSGAINLEADVVLAGRYTVQEQIGEGGMGAVYRAHDANTGKDIALKILLPALLKNQRALDRFLDEARISQQLSHPNIVNVFDVQQDQSFTFLTMELLEGQDLRQVMENRKLARQPLAVDEVQEIITAVSTALTYAHKYTVHRDIKPENIWLSEQGDYKIMDFGIARVQSTSQRTQTGAAMGTAYYMAPEQLKGQADIDGRADQYALAVLAYELLSGEVPAGMIEPIQQHRKDIPKAMASAIHQALSPRPENRFATIDAFNQAVLIKGSSLSTLPFKTIGIAAGVLLAVLLIGGLVSGGGLDNLWDALKPIDKELIAKQKAEAAKLIAKEKAEAAKLIGEIKNYQRRLENARRQLNSDLRDANRNDSTNEKHFEHWQSVTDKYLFEGDQLSELEGELTMGESLLRDNSNEQAKITLIQVRDGYKNLWKQFNAAEHLYPAEKKSQAAKNNWVKRKNDYGLDAPASVGNAEQLESAAKESQGKGDLIDAVKQWELASSLWGEVYRSVSKTVTQIDRQRVLERKAIAERKRLKIVRDQQLREEKIRRAKLEEQQLKQDKLDNNAVFIHESQQVMNEILNNSKVLIHKGPNRTKQTYQLNQSIVINLDGSLVTMIREGYEFSSGTNSKGNNFSPWEVINNYDCVYKVDLDKFSILGIGSFRVSSLGSFEFWVEGKSCRKKTVSVDNYLYSGSGYGEKVGGVLRRNFKFYLNTTKRELFYNNMKRVQELIKLREKLLQDI